MMAWFAGQNHNYIRLAMRLRKPFAWAMIGLGVLGLSLGFSGAIAMHPMTGLCLIGLGVCILGAQRFGRSPLWQQLTLSIILAVCAARGVDALLTGLTGSPMGRIFGPLIGFSGMFSIQAAITLSAFAGAALARRHGGRLGGAMLMLGLFVVFNTALKSGFNVSGLSHVNVVTLIGMLCAALAMVTIFLHRPNVRVSFLVGEVGSVTRVMAFVCSVMPWGIGVVMQNFRASGGLTSFEATVFSAMSFMMLAVLLFTSSRKEGAAVMRARARRYSLLEIDVAPIGSALNRSGISEFLESAWVNFKAAGAKFAVILVDLEYLRRVDATFGLDDGDGFLKRVNETLLAQLRTSDALGRWSSDEMLVLVKIKQRSDIDVVTNRLRAALCDVRNPFGAGLTIQPASMEVPMGASDIRGSDTALAEALIRADVDLHETKMRHALAKDASKNTGDAQNGIPVAEDTVETRKRAAA